MRLLPGSERQTKGVFTPAQFGPLKTDQGSFPTLVQTFGTGVITNHQTMIWTKQPDRDPLFEVVSVRFQTDSGAEIAPFCALRVTVGPRITAPKANY